MIKSIIQLFKDLFPAAKKLSTLHSVVLWINVLAPIITLPMVLINWYGATGYIALNGIIFLLSLVKLEEIFDQVLQDADCPSSDLTEEIPGDDSEDTTSM